MSKERETTDRAVAPSAKRLARVASLPVASKSKTFSSEDEEWKEGTNRVKVVADKMAAASLESQALGDSKFTHSHALWRKIEWRDGRVRKMIIQWVVKTTWYQD